MYPHSFTPKKSQKYFAAVPKQSTSLVALPDGACLFVNTSSLAALNRSIGLAIFENISRFKPYVEISFGDHLKLVEEVVVALYADKNALKNASPDEAAALCGKMILNKIGAYVVEKHSYEFLVEKVFGAMKKKQQSEQS